MLIEEGMRFGQWTVVGDGPFYKGTNPYIECRCDCGREYDVRTHSLRDGSSTKCKLCKYRAHSEKMKKPDTGWNIWYYRYKSNAKNRKLSFELDIDVFRALCIQDCYYCGDSPRDTQVSQSADIVANGIDRVDSAYGYTPGNCVPCCTTCNMMKRNMSQTFFLTHIEKIKKKRR